MSSEEKRPKAHTFAVVVATAAVTLAVGVTTAALTGHLAPRPQLAPQAIAAAPATPPVERDPPPSVVFVPITRDQPAAPRVRAARHQSGSPVLAAAQSEREDDEGEHEHVAAAEDTGEHEDDDD